MNGELRNASGEEARMLEVLTTAYERFGDQSYLDRAEEIAEGMKGVNGQGVFEPAHPFVFSTDQGAGGDETITSGPQLVRFIHLDLRQGITPNGYSLSEVEVYAPDDPLSQRNLALGGDATARCSNEIPGFEAEKAIDGDVATRWAVAEMSDPQCFDLDLGELRMVDRVVLKWYIAAAASEYDLRYSPDYEPEPADGFLLRPWFAWDPVTEDPISRPWHPYRVPLNVNNLVGYYKVATLLNDVFYQNVLNHTIDTILSCQNPDTEIFLPQYDLLLHGCFDEKPNDEEGTGDCSVLACTDIATRLGAYARLVDRADLIDAGARYFKFLKGKYLSDGVAWFSYDYNDGHPVDLITSLSVYVFFAKTAIEYQDWDLAEKILREQVLPLQVASGSGHPSLAEPGYLGAFKQRVHPVTSFYADALAFDNLEALVALNLWNHADKGSWTSSYPIWDTVATVQKENGEGLLDDVPFAPVRTRYVRILALERGTDFGDSIFTLKVLDAGGQDLAAGKPVSVSSTESPELTGPRAVDGDDSTRWSSVHGIDPQWIYVDLGEPRWVSGVEVLWETAFATDYEVQAGIVPSIGCVDDADTACLQGERFRVEVDWRAPPAFPDERPARVSELGTPDAALFFFLDPDNLEFLIKVLDGCAITNHFWVFFAASTNVEFTVTVTDTLTGDQKQYENPLGQPADAVTDTMAFATCP